LFVALMPPYAFSAAISVQEADQATQSFNTAFWNAGGKYFYKKDNRSGVLDFWMSAHAWETIMDAYVRTGATSYKTQVKDVYDGFISNYGADWSRNHYNDDIMWWVLASTHAYDVTGEVRYLTQAKTYFDWVYDKQRDAAFGGGIWWMNTAHNQKNSCVVQPAIIAAVNLSRQLKDNGYRVKAESLYAWQKRTLTDGNGKVYDNIDSTGVNKGSLTYNQGTFIGAALALGHIADAEKAADWTKANLADANGILRNEGQGDFGTFKLIFIRYGVQLGRTKGDERYLTWLESNASNVWSNRRSTDNVMGFDWANPAPATGIECQSAAGGVALLNLVAMAPAVAVNAPESGPGSRADATGRSAVAGFAGSGVVLMPFLGGLRAVDGRFQPASR
jgi:predicted alpha-1,6-mannanase (GH76 family)